MPKKFVPEPFSVSLISGIKKFWIRVGGSIAIFRRSFCLTVPNFFIGEHFGFSEKLFIENFHALEAGHLGFVKNFCLTGPKRKDF